MISTGHGSRKILHKYQLLSSLLIIISALLTLSTKCLAHSRFSPNTGSANEWELHRKVINTMAAQNSQYYSMEILSQHPAVPKIDKCVLKSSPLLIPWTMSSLSCTRCSNAKSQHLWKALFLTNMPFQILTSIGSPKIQSQNPPAGGSTVE